MLRLDILQSQWVMLSLVGGLALVGVLVLAYLPMWRPRGRLDPAAEDEAGQTPRAWLPWVLTVVYLATVVYAVAYVMMAAGKPPNW